MEVIQNGSTQQMVVDDSLDWRKELIFIPTVERGRPATSLDLSVRLRNVLEQRKLHLLGSLHGRSYGEFANYRNCGRKTLTELRDVVRQLQHGANEATPTDWQVLSDPNVLEVSDSARELKLAELPMSVRLENALKHRGCKKLGDLNGIDVRELLKIQNC